MYVEFKVEKRLGDFLLRAAGEIRPSLTCLVGPNGSGKTTLMKVLAGVMAPDAGYVKRVGIKSSVYVGDFYVPPEAYGLDVVLAGRTRLSRRAVTRGDEKVAVKYAEAFGVASLLKRRWHTLSGGQRQLLVMAAAAAAEADFTLIDEPLANLHPDTRAWALSALKGATFGKLVAVSTHNFDVLKCCDFVVAVDGGVVTWAGPASAFEPPRPAAGCGT